MRRLQKIDNLNVKIPVVRQLKKFGDLFFLSLDLSEKYNVFSKKEGTYLFQFGIRKEIGNSETKFLSCQSVWK